MQNFQVEPIHLNKPSEKEAVISFLSGFDLKLDTDVDYTVVIRGDGEIIATCSKAKNVLKCFAVKDAFQGEGLSATLMTSLIDKLFSEGIYHYFVFTMPDKVSYFENLNFRLLYKGKEAALLEGGIYTIEQKLEEIKKKYRLESQEEKVALVMNCNPFTRGHLHLIETAARSGKTTIVFLVEEDRSVFRFVDRLEMVKRGTSHIPNVTVVPGTEYIISSSTFPSYFFRKEDDKTAAYMELDAGLFCKAFCKAFKIKTRYVGEEPYCDVTHSYNQTLKWVFEQNEIDLIEIPRIEFDAEAISASRVRAYLKEDRWEALAQIVPATTLDYLKNTVEGQAAVQRVKISDTPH